MPISWPRALPGPVHRPVWPRVRAALTPVVPEVRAEGLPVGQSEPVAQVVVPVGQTEPAVPVEQVEQVELPQVELPAGQVAPVWRRKQAAEALKSAGPQEPAQGMKAA